MRILSYKMQSGQVFSGIWESELITPHCNNMNHCLHYIIYALVISASAKIEIVINHSKKHIDKHQCVMYYHIDINQCEVLKWN